MRRTRPWLVACLIVTLIAALLTLSPSASAQGAPGLTILSPAGALTPSPIVRTSFVVSFTLTNFQLVAPGAPGLVNAPEQGHIHVFLDGDYYAIWDSAGPIPFDVAPGNHTIRLQLVNNFHAALTPDISQTISVMATDAPAGSPELTILSPAGALNADTTVGSSFKVSFLIRNFQLADPIGQSAALNMGHIHVFLDGKYYSIVASEGPIAFDLLTAGQHTIKLQLVNNDHTPLTPDVSKTITVTASSIPVAAQVDLSGLVNGQSTLQNWAKANSAYRTVPAALRTGNMDLRLNCTVFRLDTDESKKVTAARYLDAQGNIHVQPGKVFFNGIWGFNLIRLMLLSGIGNPYHPASIEGSLGRGAAMGVGGAAVRGVTGTLDNVGGNSYPAGNALGGGYAMLDLADDNFDHTGLDFIGGSYVIVGSYLGGGPNNFGLYSRAPSPNMMGSTFKAGIKDAFLPQKLNLNIRPSGMWAPTTDWFIDLDPHYVDKYGDPEPRLTMDWGMNTVKAANYLAQRYVEILQRMGASNVQLTDPVLTEDHMFAWPAHIRGGARIGSNPDNSVFNKWHQCWTSENLFAAGEVCHPTGDNTTTGGTHPAGPTSYVAAEGIKKYLQSPGDLV